MNYSIRYRAYRPDGKTALILEDAAGIAYLFSAGTLHCATRGPHAVARLCALLPAAAWRLVPPVAPYPLSELFTLVGFGALPGIDQHAA
jgi:hypothetical protein